MCLEVVMVTLKIIYKKYDNITCNTTENITKHINKYSNYIVNTYRINNKNNVKKTYCNFNDDITLNNTSNMYYNDTYNITKNNNSFNITDNQ